MPKESIILSWIESVKEVDSRRKEWEGSLKKIEELVSDNTLVWDDLDLPYQELTMTPKGEKKLKEELWSYAVWVLVDACIRAHKRAFEEAFQQWQRTQGEKNVDELGF